MPITVATVPVPVPGDNNDFPADMTALANSIGPRLISQFASTSERDSAFPSPIQGQECWVGAVRYIYTAYGWRTCEMMYYAANATEQSQLAATATAARPIYVDYGGVIRRYTGPTAYTTLQIAEDTGWVTQTITDTTNFGIYSGAPAPQIRRLNGVVYFTAQLSAKIANSITSGDGLVAMVVPAQFRPAGNCTFRCQGSGTDSFCFSTGATGNLRYSRYSGTQPVGAWLPVTAQWPAG